MTKESAAYLDEWDVEACINFLTGYLKMRAPAIQQAFARIAEQTRAVNALPVHEAAREALERLLDAVDGAPADEWFVTGPGMKPWQDARAALARLRDEVPAALTPDQERMVEEQLS